MTWAEFPDAASPDMRLPEGFGTLPGPFRMLLGLDGTLTRSLAFLSGSPVSVERVVLPGGKSGPRKVFLSVPEYGRLVFARTRLLDAGACPDGGNLEVLMNGERAIGVAMEAAYGPLLKEAFSIQCLSGPFDPDCREGDRSTWARSYRMKTSGGIVLSIEEFFLPALFRLAGA